MCLWKKFNSFNQSLFVYHNVFKLFDRFVAELRERQGELESELDAFLSREQQQLQQAQEDMAVSVVSAASYCDSAEGALNRSATHPITEQQLHDMYRSCRQYLQQTQQEENRPLPENNPVSH